MSRARVTSDRFAVASLLDRPAPGRWPVWLAGAVIVLSLAAAPSYAECPQGDRLSIGVTIARDGIDPNELFELGADVLGPDGDRWAVRVCPHILEQLAARDIAYEVAYDDLYAAYAEYRAGLNTRYGESFSAYHDYDATVEVMQQIASDHPDLAALEEIGRSVEDRPIYALRISQGATTVAPDKPGMLVMGCHHAREWITVEAPLYFADYLTDFYLQNGQVTLLLNHTEIWIVPIVNPDGRVYTATDRWWRKNRRDNGDGTIGVDLNRNYSIGFGGSGASGNTNSDTYHGPSAFSEPETQAIRDLMTGVFVDRDFASGLSYHSYGQVIMYPNGYTFDPTSIDAYYRAMADEMADLINGTHSDPQYNYTTQQSAALYIASGTTTDWVHNEVGAYGIIIEQRPIGSPWFDLPPDEIIPTNLENLPAFLYMAEHTMIPDLSLSDSDLDGFLDVDDYCPNSPNALVDSWGCGLSEQDMDEDGVENISDECLESLPGQQVGADGCRVDTLFTLAVESNIDSVDIVVAPADIDAAGEGNTGTDGFDRQYAQSTALLLTAAEHSDASLFRRWIVDGVEQTDEQPTISLEADSDTTVSAIYTDPDRVEIVGPGRIADLHDNGIATVTTYRAQVVYNDGTIRAVDGESEWSLGDGTAGLMLPTGDLIAYDVPAVPGERMAPLTVAVILGSLTLTSDPLDIEIFDSATLMAYCDQIAITGPLAVGSGTTYQIGATVLYEGNSQSTDATQDVNWTADRVDGTGAVPATVSATGALTTDWVSTDTEIIVRATLVNGNDTQCSTEWTIVILAGSPTVPTDGDNGTTSTNCGNPGVVALLAMALGLTLFRYQRP